MRHGDERSGPYAHADTSVNWIMLQVILALIPATLFGLWAFGWPAINLFVVTGGAAMATEVVCLWLAAKPIRPALADGSAVLTGWLLAVSLPAWAPWWVGVVGSVIAIVIGKHIFGGLGQNPFNPAMVARVALLISFPLPMTRYVMAAPLGSTGAPGFLDGLAITFGSNPAVDAMTAASALGDIKSEWSRGIPVTDTLAAWGGPIGAPADLAIGLVPGSLGETSAILILIGGLFLVWRGVIAWQIPVGMMAAIAGLASLFHLIDPGRHADAFIHLTAGATLLGAFFIATDPVTSPVTATGRLLFGLGCGALTWVIRSFAGYPEGLAFAILLMNALTPLIDRGVRPRIHGRTRKGDPLPLVPPGKKG